MDTNKVYLASSMSMRFRKTIEAAAVILRKRFSDVYVPMENFVKNAWDYPNNEWGLMVFQNDINAMDRSDYVVILNYGRKNTTAGCAWEAGYAFASGKKVFVVDVDKIAGEDSNEDEFITSLMVENGRYATIRGLEGLAGYDWGSLPKTRTEFEQK